MTWTADEVKRSMHDMVPRYYEDSKVATNILDREADEIARASADIYDVLAQFFIETATWGLSQWERVFNITSSSSQTYAQRREVLLGKLRGVGAVSAELIESVASAYSNGEVDVVADVPAYLITVKFVGSYGVPAQLDALKASLRDIIPAHLNVVYEFKYYTYGELAGTGKTYGDIATYTYEDIYNRRF